jgi:hypothetical protein
MSLESQFGDGACHLDYYQRFEINAEVDWMKFAWLGGYSNGCPQSLNIIQRDTKLFREKGVADPEIEAAKKYVYDHLPHNIWWSYIVERSFAAGWRLPHELTTGVENFDPHAKHFDPEVVPPSYLEGKRTGLVRDTAFEITTAILHAITLDEKDIEKSHSQLLHILDDIDNLFMGDGNQQLPVRSLNELHLSLVNRGWISTES